MDREPRLERALQTAADQAARWLLFRSRLMTRTDKPLVERLRNLATALVCARQGVTEEAAKALPPCDPVTVADAMEEAADALEAVSEIDYWEGNGGDLLEYAMRRASLQEPVKKEMG